MSHFVSGGHYGEIKFELSVGVTQGRYRTSDFVQQIIGRVFSPSQSDKPGQESGYIRALLIQFGSALGLISAQEFRESLPESVANYWDEFFEPGSFEWKEQLLDEFQVDRCDFLILDSIRLDPSVRGHGLGLTIVERTIDIFGVYCALVACHPRPTEGTPPEKGGESFQELAEAHCDQKAVRKLQLHFSKAGFGPFGTRGFYVRNPALIVKGADQHRKEPVRIN